MKTTVLSLLIVGLLLALAGWVGHVPGPVQANELPAKYRETIRKGLEYLAKHQFPDGHWEGDGGNHSVAMTGLVGLALLMDRNVPSGNGKPAARRESKYAASIRKAEDWLMEKAQAGRDGLIFSDHASESSRYMQGHGLATLFLAGAFVDETDEQRQKNLHAALARAVKYIANAQSSQGGWYDTSKVEGHDFDTISATAIQIQALQAAENVGIPVPDGILHDGQQYLKKALAKFKERETTNKDRSRPADTAAALVCVAESSSFSRDGRVFGGEINDDLRKTAFRYCESQTAIPLGREIKFGHDELAHCYYAQAEHNRGGEVWSGYRTATFDQLRDSQNNDGSWPAGDGICVGPVYSTAVWCTVLQLDNNSHPCAPRELVLVE